MDTYIVDIDEPYHIAQGILDVCFYPGQQLIDPYWIALANQYGVPLLLRNPADGGKPVGIR